MKTISASVIATEEDQDFTDLMALLKKNDLQVQQVNVETVEEVLTAERDIHTVIPEQPDIVFADCTFRADLLAKLVEMFPGLKTIYFGCGMCVFSDKRKVSDHALVPKQKDYHQTILSEFLQENFA